MRPINALSYSKHFLDICAAMKIHSEIRDTLALSGGMDSKAKHRSASVHRVLSGNRDPRRQNRCFFASYLLRRAHDDIRVARSSSSPASPDPPSLDDTTDTEEEDADTEEDEYDLPGGSDTRIDRDPMYFSEDETEDEDSTKPPRDDREWMFSDVATINVRGGCGGDGCMALLREHKLAQGGPSGGNGGDGGDVYIELAPGLWSLESLKRKVHFRAKDGGNGLGKSCHGTRGDDAIIRVPSGTIVRYADGKGSLIGEISESNPRMLVARGGRGGRGNKHFKNARRKVPMFSERGEVTEERGLWLRLELRIISDAAIIGLPNAGKSTLLAASSSAEPKIADYAFTTVVPNIGIVQLTEYDGAVPSLQSSNNSSSSGSSSGGGIVGSGSRSCRLGTGSSTSFRLSSGRYEATHRFSLLDVPGLLPGAHFGVGLGNAFLRHIQKCRVLIHVVDVNSVDPVSDYICIRTELERYSAPLTQKPELVVLNKIDKGMAPDELKIIFDSISRAAGHDHVYYISALTREGVETVLSNAMHFSAMPHAPEPVPHIGAAGKSHDNRYTEGTSDNESTLDVKITTEKDDIRVFSISNKWIKNLAQKTNFEQPEGVRRLYRVLEYHGVFRELRERHGAREGDCFSIGTWVTYFPEDMMD